MKFATKPIQRYPPHLRHVSTLPWEIKNSNFLQTFSRYGSRVNRVSRVRVRINLSMTRDKVSVSLSILRLIQ